MYRSTNFLGQYSVLSTGPSTQYCTNSAVLAQESTEPSHSYHIRECMDGCDLALGRLVHISTVLSQYQLLGIVSCIPFGSLTSFFVYSLDRFVFVANNGRYKYTSIIQFRQKVCIILDFMEPDTRKQPKGCFQFLDKPRNNKA